jgi:hypothetical protein
MSVIRFVQQGTKGKECRPDPISYHPRPSVPTPTYISHIHELIHPRYWLCNPRAKSRTGLNPRSTTLVPLSKASIDSQPEEHL